MDAVRENGTDQSPVARTLGADTWVHEAWHSRKMNGLSLEVRNVRNSLTRMTMTSRSRRRKAITPPTCDVGPPRRVARRSRIAPYSLEWAPNRRQRPGALLRGAAALRRLLHDRRGSSRTIWEASAQPAHAEVAVVGNLCESSCSVAVCRVERRTRTRQVRAPRRRVR